MSFPWHKFVSLLCCFYQLWKSNCKIWNYGGLQWHMIFILYFIKLHSLAVKLKAWQMDSWTVNVIDHPCALSFLHIIHTMHNKGQKLYSVLAEIS